MIQFICYPKCTTCQRAKKWLDDHGIGYELRNIKSDNPTREELTAWYARSGLPLKRFFNTSGLLYKSFDLKNKLPTMTEEKMLALLATDGMLQLTLRYASRRSSDPTIGLSTMVAQMLANHILALAYPAMPYYADRYKRHRRALLTTLARTEQT